MREEIQAWDNDRKGHIPSVLQDEIAQLALVDLISSVLCWFRNVPLARPLYSAAAGKRNRSRESIATAPLLAADMMHALQL